MNAVETALREEHAELERLRAAFAVGAQSRIEPPSALVLMHGTAALAAADAERRQYNSDYPVIPPRCS